MRSDWSWFTLPRIYISLFAVRSYTSDMFQCIQGRNQDCRIRGRVWMYIIHSATIYNTPFFFYMCCWNFRDIPQHESQHKFDVMSLIPSTLKFFSKSTWISTFWRRIRKLDRYLLYNLDEIKRFFLLGAKYHTKS